MDKVIYKDYDTHSYLRWVCGNYGQGAIFRRDKENLYSFETVNYNIVCDLTLEQIKELRAALDKFIAEEEHALIERNNLQQQG